MMDRESYAASLPSRFDSYCKKVIRNCFRNIVRAYQRRRNWETWLDESMIRNEGYHEIHSVYCVECRGIQVQIANDDLRIALDMLPETEKVVIILRCFRHWTDKRIADYLGLSVRAIYDRRQKGFYQLRLFLELDKWEGNR